MARLPSAEVPRARAVDLLTLVSSQGTLRRVASSGGGEWAGPCPLCGGRDRFRVQPTLGRWLCRGCTPRWEDAITLQRRLTGQSFTEAVAALIGARWPVITPHPPTSRVLQPQLWQGMARLVAAEAAGLMWRPAGRRAREWLHARGLCDETLHRWWLGWRPRTIRYHAQRWGLAGAPLIVPAGIAIPDPCGLALKVRRFGVSRGKYWLVRGSTPGLYLAETLAGATVACLVEGELDALLLWQELQDNPVLARIGVATTGSQSPHPRQEWLAALRDKRLLLLHDQDAAGEQGVARWHAARPDAMRVRWPAGKDLTEYHGLGGDLGALIESAVTQVRR